MDGYCSPGAVVVLAHDDEVCGVASADEVTGVGGDDDLKFRAGGHCAPEVRHEAMEELRMEVGLGFFDDHGGVDQAGKEGILEGPRFLVGVVDDRLVFGFLCGRCGCGVGDRGEGDRELQEVDVPEPGDL